MNETNETEIGELLTLKQERFCFNYTQNEEYHGNATLSYADAYEYDLDSLPKNDGTYKTKEGEILYGHEIDSMAQAGAIYKTAKVVEPSTWKKTYDLCSSLGSRLRRNAKIQSRCRDLLNEFMVENVVDARLTKIIVYGSDDDAINAIKEFNKLRGRIIDKKDITSQGERVVGFTLVPPVAPAPIEPTPQHEDNITPNQTN